MQKIILIAIYGLICVIHCDVQTDTKKPKKITIITTKLPQTKQRYFDPNYGYEPYWPGGDWIVARSLPNNATTVAPPMVCGAECHYMFRNITKVCARHVDNLYVRGCKRVENVRGCYGDSPDELTKGYETFPTYCQFLDKRCQSAGKTRPPLYKWILVHLGECEKDQNLTFKPLLGTEPKERMKVYLEQQKNVFEELKRTPCFK